MILLLCVSLSLSTGISLATYQTTPKQINENKESYNTSLDTFARVNYSKEYFLNSTNRKVQIEPSLNDTKLLIEDMRLARQYLGTNKTEWINQNATGDLVIETIDQLLIVKKSHNFFSDLEQEVNIPIHSNSDYLEIEIQNAQFRFMEGDFAIFRIELVFAEIEKQFVVGIVLNGSTSAITSFETFKDPNTAAYLYPSSKYFIFSVNDMIETTNLTAPVTLEKIRFFAYNNNGLNLSYQFSKFNWISSVNHTSDGIKINGSPMEFNSTFYLNKHQSYNLSLVQKIQGYVRFVRVYSENSTIQGKFSFDVLQIHYNGSMTFEEEVKNAFIEFPKFMINFSIDDGVKTKINNESILFFDRIHGNLRIEGQVELIELSVNEQEIIQGETVSFKNQANITQGVVFNETDWISTEINEQNISFIVPSNWGRQSIFFIGLNRTGFGFVKEFIINLELMRVVIPKLVQIDRLQDNQIPISLFSFKTGERLTGFTLSSNLSFPLTYTDTSIMVPSFVLDKGNITVQLTLEKEGYRSLRTEISIEVLEHPISWTVEPISNSTFYGFMITIQNFSRYTNDMFLELKVDETSYGRTKIEKEITWIPFFKIKGNVTIQAILSMGDYNDVKLVYMKEVTEIQRVNNRENTTGNQGNTQGFPVSNIGLSAILVAGSTAIMVFLRYKSKEGQISF